MNERIKELLSQSGMLKILDEHASEYGGGWYQAEHYPELQRFAESIVNECVFQACNNFGSSGQFYEGAKYAANQIKQHFGVT